jgi:hypothetical protein
MDLIVIVVSKWCTLPIRSVILYGDFGHSFFKVSKRVKKRKIMELKNSFETLARISIYYRLFLSRRGSSQKEF